MRRVANGIRLAAAVVALGLLCDHALAASSLGIGVQEPTLGPIGPFGHFFFWITNMQATFYRAMTTALKQMHTSIWSAPLMIGLSFAYGVFHAVGPGHGKAVISSYMLANETTLRRGVLLSFASSILQALTAIAVVGAAWRLLQGTGIQLTDAAQFMESGSFALVAVFGLWLLWRKAPGFARAWFSAPAPAVALVGDGPHAHEHVHAESCSHVDEEAHAHEDAHEHSHHHHHDHDHDEGCGHVHMADPRQLADEFNWKTAGSAIASVGLRPCSGAIIVLTFALLNGLVLGGVLSVFAMAFGTFITVATLAILAVTAKNVAMRFAGTGVASARLHSLIEVGAALLVLVLGLVLFAASLYR